MKDRGVGLGDGDWGGIGVFKVDAKLMAVIVQECLKCYNPNSTIFKQTTELPMALKATLPFNAREVHVYLNFVF